MLITKPSSNVLPAPKRMNRSNNNDDLLYYPGKLIAKPILKYKCFEKHKKFSTTLENYTKYSKINVITIIFPNKSIEFRSQNLPPNLRSGVDCFVLLPAIGFSNGTN